MTASLGHVLAQIQRWTSPRLQELSDAVLLERFVQHHDESAFAALVARHGEMVLRSCRRVLNDEHEAEDAFQATFLILARQARTLRQADALPGFLHSVARRVALKARSKTAARAGQSFLAEELPAAHSDPLAHLTARELLVALDEEVARLPAAQRSAVVLCCLEGRTQEEAARLLGWTSGSLRGHLERGRNRLQARLRRRGITIAAALAVVAVSRGEAASGMLVQHAVQAALRGGSGSAAALAHSVLQEIFLPKLAGGMAVVLTVALAASTAVAWIYRGSSALAPEEQKPAVLASPREAGADKPKPRTDALGDPLPDGAIARLGTVRFRHGGCISYVTYTPDGKWLISKGIDGVRVWDPSTGKERWHLALEPNRDRGTVDLSPDGKILATINPGPGNPVQLWDVDSGRKIGSLGTKLQPPIRFSLDGKWLVATSGRRDVELWDLAGRKKLRSWAAHDADVWSISFSADSRKLLTSDTMGKVHLWDAASGRKLQEFEPLSWDAAIFGPSTNAVPALSADGKLLSILEVQKRPSPKPIKEPKTRISVWDTATGKVVRQLTCPSPKSDPNWIHSFNDLTLAPDGKTLATSGPDSFLRFWDLTTGQELRRLPIDGDGRLVFLAFSRDGKSLAGASDGTIRILDVVSGKFKLSPGGRMSSLRGALLTPDGRTAITGGHENGLLVWDAATGQLKRRLERHESYTLSLQMSGDGRTLYSTGWDKVMRVWDVASGEARRRIEVEKGYLWTGPNPIVSPDGKTMLATDSERTIRVLDMATGQERRRFQLEGLCGMALSADGRTLAGCSSVDRRMFRVWDVASGRKRSEGPLPLIGDELRVYSMALSPDGRLLAVGRPHQIGAEFPKKHFLLLIDVASGQEFHRLDNVPTGVDNLVFSPNGHMLAWGGFTHPAIRLLETATCRERRRLTGHRGAVNAMSFSADGRRLLSGSGDTTALVWDFVGDHVRGPATDAECEALWADLAGDDAARAYRAIHRFAALPSATISFMRNHLHPIAAVDEKRLVRWIADLDSDDFAIREKATTELQSLGERARLAYRKALESKPSLESRRRLEDLQAKAHRARWILSGERLRGLRAIEALELAGTEEAREVLQTLASGATGARLTDAAKATLNRLANGVSGTFP